jgi:hypothetical protein
MLFRETPCGFQLKKVNPGSRVAVRTTDIVTEVPTGVGGKLNPP